MFKAIPYIVKLHLSKNVEYRVNHVAHFSQSNTRLQKTTYSQVEERDPCRPPSPCPPPPKDDRAFWSAMAILFTAGCFGVYAKHNEEVRDWLTINAAWFDDLIAIAYQENKTYGEHAMDLVKAVQDFLAEKPRLCTEDGTPIKPLKEKKKCTIDSPCKKEEKGAAKPEVEPAIKGICEIEKCLLNAGETSYNNYWTAKEACRYYNELVEDSLTNFSYHKLKALRAAMLERYEMLNEYVCAGAKALRTLDEMARLLECGVSAPKEAIDNTNAMLKEHMARVKVIQTEYIWENDKSVSLDAKWQNVEKLIDKYVTENEILFPGTVYASKKPSLSADPDILFLHTLRYKNMLEVVLKESSQAATERANRGIETLSQDKKDVMARDMLIQNEYKKKQMALDLYYKKRVDQVKADYDTALKKAMKKQTEAHERALETGLKDMEEQATVKLNKMVAEEIEAQKKRFANELADMSVKVGAVEEKLNARLKAEREAKRSQQLWTAGASLLAATKKGDPRIRVDKEIRAIEAAAGDGDKLVSTVLKSIPDDVRKVGVVPESVLRERYHQMEDTARNVALVELEGSPMPVYIMSWLQSTLLFMKLSGVPQTDIDKPFKEKKDMEDLDTFDRLHLARYWLEQGSLAAALYYVDSLEGASRVAAEPWYKDAKSHLEIKQAAEAVIAHATALGLQYI